LREALRTLDHDPNAVGLSSDEVTAKHNFYPITDPHINYHARPGELAIEKFEILKHDSGLFLKAWTVIEECDGESWRQVPYMSAGKFSLKRKHHFSEPITRAEALSLVRKHLIPEEFQNDLVAPKEGSQGIEP
jgi:hypothetical protein